MKQTLSVLFLFVAVGLFTSLEAQIKTPAPSPSCKVEQTVGLTTVTLEYSRPSKKGRKIFGDLVPYGKKWRTGANAATKITFSDDVQVGGKDLKKGAYALFTTPGATSWDIHFFEHTTSNSGGYGDATAAATVSVAPQTLPFSIETFGMSVEDLTNESASILVIWDNVAVGIPLAVHTDKVAMASIEKTLAGPTAGDYYNAGTYLASKGEDLATALTYIQKATKGDSPRFWQVKQEAEVLAKLGKKAQAIKAAEKSLALATEAGNADYVKMNKDNIAKWSKM